MDIKTKAVAATIEDTSASADEFPGTFLVELSNESLDRDGDILKADEWETPLPQQITFVNDHTHKMASVVGSAAPTLEGGKIICRGTWATTANAQDTRKVIPHVPYVSVAYREKRNQKSGTVSRELINGSFVVVPSNPGAKVLASKSIGEMFQEAGIDGAEEFAGAIAKALAESGIAVSGNVYHVKMNDPNAHGLTFIVNEKSSTVQVKQHGNLLGEHKFSQSTEGTPKAEPDADPAKKDAAALDQLKAAATQIITGTTV